MSDFSEYNIIGSLALETIISKHGILSYAIALNKILNVWIVWIIHNSFKHETDVSMAIRCNSYMCSLFGLYIL